MSVELCRCGGAICAHGSCTRCDRFCEHCGAGGRQYYEDRMEETGGSYNEREEVFTQSVHKF
jgi:hypothetical protein